MAEAEATNHPQPPTSGRANNAEETQPEVETEAEAATLMAGATPVPHSVPTPPTLQLLPLLSVLHYDYLRLNFVALLDSNNDLIRKGLKLSTNFVCLSAPSEKGQSWSKVAHLLINFLFDLLEQTNAKCLTRRVFPLGS